MAGKDRTNDVPQRYQRVRLAAREKWWRQHLSEAARMSGVVGDADGAAISINEIDAMENQAKPVEETTKGSGLVDTIATTIGNLTSTGVKTTLVAVIEWSKTAAKSIFGILFAGTVLGVSLGFGATYVPELFTKEYTYIGITRGVSSASCANGQPADVDKFLQDARNYTTERHIWKIKVRDKAFTGTQSLNVPGNSDLPLAGSIVVGKNIVGYQRGDNTFGSYYLTSGPTNILTGVQVAPDCATKVELSCPYVLGPVEQEDAMKNLSIMTLGVCTRVVPAQPSRP